MIWAEIWITLEDMLVKGVSLLWFLLLDRNSRVLDSGWTFWAARRRLTADIVTLEVVVDSLARLEAVPFITTSGNIGCYSDG